ncbi:hypothetical protein [Dehalobacter restrictus]|uniref:phenylacetate--CoA ligase family protein n=1 Tax=Dehalobacter restrictus TaxID=55583 RepID=UPI00338F35CE
MREQLDKLKKIVKFAVEHSAFYRNLYSEKGIRWDTLTSVEELPIVSPADLIKSPFDFKSDAFDIYKICMSSGTVSAPKVFFRTIEDYEHSVANEAILLGLAGVISEDMLCIAQTFGISGYGELTLDACKKLKIPVLPIGEVSDDLLGKCIIDFGITVLDISPSKFAKLSQHIDWKSTKVRLAMMSGETISASVANIASQNGIDIVNQYGSTEFDALAGQKIGDEYLTLLSDDFIFEIVDSELIVTSLYHQGTPMIRYCLGDNVNIYNDKIDIHGREDSVLLFDGIKLFGEQLENLLSNKCLIWQCLVSRNSTGISLELLINPIEDKAGIEKEIENEIKNSTDIYGYVQNREIFVCCSKTTKFLSRDGRKFPRYIDLRNFSLNNLLKLVEAERYDLFFANLQSPLSINLCNEIHEVLLTATHERRYACAKYLIQIWSQKSRKIGELLFKSCIIENKSAVVQDMKKMAKSDDWEIREEAAKLFAVFLLCDFSRNLKWIASNLQNKNENMRRATMLALKYACLNIDEKSKLRKMVNLLDTLLYDGSEYVRKSFDSFTIGDAFLYKCPDIVEAKLDEWLSRNDTLVNCAIIRVFRSSGGTRTWPLAKKYLDIFKGSDDRKIQKALSITSLYLSKRIPNLSQEA